MSRFSFWRGLLECEHNGLILLMMVARGAQRVLFMRVEGGAYVLDCFLLDFDGMMKGGVGRLSSWSLFPFYLVCAECLNMEFMV